MSLHEELLFLVCNLGDTAGKLMSTHDLEVSLPVVLLVVVLQANTYAYNTLWHLKTSNAPKVEHV
jgi:hypothetical protein